jgi:FkbM family methyltransferase
MRQFPSVLPDRLLSLSQALPWPFRSRVWDTLQRHYRKVGRQTGELTRIRFGGIEISAPLDHPAVYWRYSPQFNRNFVSVVQRVLEFRPGTVIDVGANIGDGVALLRSAGVNAPVLAIEGADIWWKLLCSNTSIFSGVELEHVFLGPEEQRANLELHIQDGSSRLIKGGSGVPITSLDRLLLGYADRQIAILKTDTDGFDLKVLLGARKLLVEQRPIIFSEIDEGLLRDQGDSSAEFVRYLAGCGYQMIEAWDNYGRWLGSRSVSQGLEDLIEKYPGGPETPYLDVAVFAQSDWERFEPTGDETIG